MEGDPSNQLSLLIICLILMILAAFFASAETAFSYCNKTRFKVRSDDNDKKAKKVQYVLDHFDDSIITILVGTNVSHILMSTLATIFAISLVGEELGSILATIIVTILVFLFAEVLPKAIAKANADKLAEASAPIIKALSFLLKPLTFILEVPFKLLVKLFKVKEEVEYTKEDLVNIVENIEEEGSMDDEDISLIQNAIEFEETPAKEIYTPLANVKGVDINLDKDEFIDRLINEDRFTRLVVYEGSIKNVVGVIHVRQALFEYFNNKKINIKKLITKPYFVKLNKKIDDILDDFNKYRTHMAIVKNAKDEVVGILTIEDVLNELTDDLIEEGDSNE